MSIEKYEREKCVLYGSGKWESENSGGGNG